MVAAVGWWMLRRPEPAALSTPPVTVAPGKPPAASQLSEARQLAERARGLFDGLESSRDDFKLADIALLRRSRLSVVPVSEEHFARILSMGETK